MLHMTILPHSEIISPALTFVCGRPRMTEYTPVRSFILLAACQTISPHLDRMLKVAKLDTAARGSTPRPPWTVSHTEI